MKILRVGDPHAKVGNLIEMKALILFVVAIAIEYGIDRIEILGDLFHTHAVLRLEVVEFWTWALTSLAETCPTVVLVGNHDQSGDYSSNYSALNIFSMMGIEGLQIVEEPTQIGIYGYAPYTHNADSFISTANRLADQGVKVLICHQTLQGSKYESGIYAPDGIPTGEWSERFVHIISGHIHSEQSFGNIIYPGTARWDTTADANRRKGIWIYEHGSHTGQSAGTVAEGTILSANFISTENVCSPIKCFEYREGGTPPTWNEQDRVAVELIGSSAWIAVEKEKLKGKCSIKTKFTDTKKSEARKAGKSLEDYLKNMFVSTMDRDQLIKTAREYGIL